MGDLSNVAFLARVEREALQRLKAVEGLRADAVVARGRVALALAQLEAERAYNMAGPAEKLRMRERVLNKKLRW